MRERERERERVDGDTARRGEARHPPSPPPCHATPRHDTAVVAEAGWPSVFVNGSRLVRHHAAGETNKLSTPPLLPTCQRRAMTSCPADHVQPWPRHADVAKPMIYVPPARKHRPGPARPRAASSCIYRPPPARRSSSYLLIVRERSAPAYEVTNCTTTTRT